MSHNIPNEIIFEILLKLPVKSLVRFRYVSKDWLSLLSSPHFINSHLIFSRTSHKSILISNPDQNISDKKCTLYSILSKNTIVNLDNPVKGSIPKIVGSCNGLLLCLVSVQDLLILWNPSTRKWKEIPIQIPQMNQNYYFTFGFGYDQCDDDYKLVLIYSSKIKNIGNEVKVYSLKNNSWKNVKGFSSGYIFNNSGVFLNGNIYWNSTQQHQDFNELNCIVKFNLETEKVQEKIDLPCYENEDIHWDLISSQKSLFGFCHRESQGQADIWVMKEHGVEKSWNKFASVPYYIMPGIFYLPLFINEDGEVLLKNGKTVVLFNVKSNMHRNLHLQIHPGISLVAYNETLVSPVVV